MIAKVQRFLPTLAGILAALGLVAGCGLLPDDGTGAEPDFGAAYDVYHLPPDQVPYFPNPHVEGDTLFVAVSYSGGCAEHTFTLRSRLVQGGAEVWLHHDTPGDPCEAYITELTRTALPQRLLDRDRLVLLEPSGAETPLK